MIINKNLNNDDFKFIFITGFMNDLQADLLTKPPQKRACNPPKSPAYLRCGGEN
ncbi:hypothetical protein [Moraxella caviae]|uniref:hypothetical protein n=1 Tax=Moraxella caviae TaxID=34060 RepID=UPI0015598562|nr:hypothetical protein [Moraxella caviae]